MSENEKQPAVPVVDEVGGAEEKGELAPETKLEPISDTPVESEPQPEPEPSKETDEATSTAGTSGPPPQTPVAVSHLSTPNAPPPKLVPRDLPTETPAGSATPAPGLMPGVDVSEFDPYATPIPSSSTSASTGQAPAKEQEQGQEQDEAQTSAAAAAAGGGAAGPSTPTRHHHRRNESNTDTPASAAVATEPVFNFSGFLKDIKSKPADPIARYLKRSVHLQQAGHCC